MNVLMVLFIIAQQPLGMGAADPAFAADGQLAVSIRGDLWVRDLSDQWVQVTSGDAWDHQPAWLPDGRIVFSSDRAGNFDLWVAAVPRPNVRVRAPEQWTRHPMWEGEIAVSADDIVFVRGTGAAARLWRRAADGTEIRVTHASASERWPSVAADGRLAYVEARDESTALRVRSLRGDSTRTVVADRAVERPSWAPNGLLVFSTRRGTPGVWLTDVDGSFVNLVTSELAHAVWHPIKDELVLVSVGLPGPGYNGDPDRVGEREAGAGFPAPGVGMLWSIDAPRTPGATPQRTVVLPELDRRTVNAEGFDRVWDRIRRLYYATSRTRDQATTWTRLRDRHRSAALEAPSDEALAAVLHTMLDGRPPYARADSGRAAVSSAHPVATAAGIEILTKGGNVVDAAVAISFTLGVVEPDASGIGGYGQMLVFQPGMRDPALIEFMTRVPEAAGLDNGSLRTGGRYPPDGPVLANVPGTVAAMEMAWKQYGSGQVSWSDVLQPAIRAARAYVVTDGLATTLAVERAHFLKYPGSKALFFRGDEPLAVGDTVRNPDLAWVLEQIANGGADAFYKGEVARRMVMDLQSHGNAMALTDLARYYAVPREAVGTAYRGYSVYASAPPSAGGATLSAQLNLLEQYPTPGPASRDAGTLHAMIEAWKLVPSSRGKIADPGLWPVDIDSFVSKDTARTRWRCFDPSRALTTDMIADLACARGSASTGTLGALPEIDPCSDGEWHRHCHRSGTTSFAVADAAGNMVSVTQTLGTWGGNFYVSPGLGFLYNDKLTSYSSDPDSYGARLPNARHGSSITPTIVLRGTGDDKQAFLATGAAGNEWITSAVYTIVTGAIDASLGPQAAIELPRFHVSRRRTGSASEFVIRMEQLFPPHVITSLDALGHRIQYISMLGELRMGYAAAVMVRDGRAIAGADPRRSGSAGAVR